jgi:ATP-dependent Clp protease ATP-binding subunit ClpX
MATKRPPRSAEDAPPSSVAILDFGRLLHHRANPAELKGIEMKLIEQLGADRNSLLKPALDFHSSRPIDSIALRVLALVAYEQLAAAKFAVGIRDVVQVIAAGDPSGILTVRQTISKLLLSKRLLLVQNSTDRIELGATMMDLLTGGSGAPPLAITECELQRRWSKAESLEAKRKAKESFDCLPTAKELAVKLSESVIGLEDQVRTFACRITMHRRRAAMIQDGKDPGSPNEALLFIGPSGCGKTWLAETAGRVCGLPFGAISATDLTSEGYVGLSVDDAVKQVITAARNDVEVARCGICFFDEWDKKRTSGWEFGSRDVAGASVQQAVLRLVEGCEFQIGGRKGSIDWYPGNIDTRGMFFTFAGAFVGLEEILGKRGAHGIGFGASGNSRSRQYLLDALQDYGMIPEFCNRLTGVLTFPPPTIEQLIEIAERAVIPAYSRLLSACGAEIQVGEPGIRLMAECAKETGTFARGLKTVVARLVEDAVFEGQHGLIQFGTADVGRALEAAGLTASTE